MKREGELSALTDGKLYRSSDMAKLGCNDCEGCSACCQGMGNSVVLDPYDVWRLVCGIGLSFEQLLTKQLLMLSMVDGLILPSLNMEASGSCPFLNEAGRCSIHAFRPGICRLFPLGRYYHGDGFSYVLMTGECRKENRTKVKIEKWLGEPELKAYEEFVMAWKRILEETRSQMQELLQKEAHRMSRKEEPGSIERSVAEEQKMLCMKLLQTYYFQPYGEQFFMEFYQR